MISGSTRDLPRRTDRSRVQGLRLHTARLLLLLGCIRLQACPQNPVSSLPPLLRCLSLCELHSMDAMHAIATSVLAQAHVRLGAPARARVLLEASLAKVLEHAPISLQGEAWLTLAKCDLQQASFKVGWERLAGCQAPVSTSREDAQR